MRQVKLHIRFGDHRTTISADNILCAMLAIKLGKQPDDARAVRQWLQERLPARLGSDRGIGKRASQAARVLMIEAIADNKVARAYDDWQIGQG